MDILVHAYCFAICIFFIILYYLVINGTECGCHGTECGSMVYSEVCLSCIRSIDALNDFHEDVCHSSLL